jgi:dienelactone hydrolase
MRPLEILIPSLLVIYLIWPLIGSRPTAIAALPALALALILIHLLTEGARWQMFPIYALAVIIFLAGLPALIHAGPVTPAGVRGWPLVRLVLGLLLLAVCTLIPVLLPVPTLLAPTGPYAIGTCTFVLTDPVRKEIYSGKDEARKFMLELWYPAIQPAPGTRPAPWMTEAKIVAPALADYIKLPHFFLDHLNLAKTDSYENIQPDGSAAPYPVLIFSHGWNGFRQQSTFLMQELASHGYIVAALEHPYGARLTVFPDGTLVPNNPAALPKNRPSDEYEAAARILVGQWTGDMAYALDFLGQLNRSDPQGQFTNLLDLDKTGVFGHSTGGGATIQFCATDPRCKAGLTLDAFTRPISLEVLDNGTKQPFLYMFSELWPFERNTELFKRYYSHVDPANHVLTILGADHYDFSDLPALSPLAPQLGLKGPINGRRVQQVIDAYVLAFFDRQFKGVSTSLFDGPQKAYPEVRYDH